VFRLKRLEKEEEEELLLAQRRITQLSEKMEESSKPKSEPVG
jgi:ribosomal protein S21